MNEKDAAKHIKKMDKYRSEYYYYHTGEKWEDPKNYDLSIDTSVLGFEKSVQLIRSYINLRMEN